MAVAIGAVMAAVGLVMLAFTAMFMMMHPLVTLAWWLVLVLAVLVLCRHHKKVAARSSHSTAQTHLRMAEHRARHDRISAGKAAIRAAGERERLRMMGVEPTDLDGYSDFVEWYRDSE